MKDEFSAERAKQFSPFSALKGLEEALYARSVKPDDRTLLAEDAAEELNKRICALQTGDIVSCVYYKAGKVRELSGCLEKICEYERVLKISGQSVKIDSIINLK